MKDWLPRRRSTMDKRFDDISRILASSTPRRGAFKLIAGVLAGTTLATFNVKPALAGRKMCCVGGARDGLKCDVADDCPGRCVGGHRDGKECKKSDGDDCPGMCIGGFRDKEACRKSDVNNCPGICSGGTRNKEACKQEFGHCPGGLCVGLANCGGLGNCLGALNCAPRD